MLSLTVLLAGSLPAAAQGLYGHNLVANGDAEAAQSNWKTYGSFTVMKYDDPSSISSSDAGPVDRGSAFFAGGSNGSTRSYAEQVISLAGVEPGARFYFSVFLGKNYGNQDPKLATATVSFLNDNGNIIQESKLAGPSNGYGDYDMPGGLVLRATSGFLTTGVTQAKVTIDFATGDSNSSNGFAADNVSLVLSQEALIGGNLVVNGGGEVPDDASLPGWTAARAESTPVPGWNAKPAPDFTADLYSEWLGSSAPAPSVESRGQYILACDTGRTASLVWQAIEIPAPKAAGVAKSKLNELIDTGKVTYKLSGWLGHYTDNSDPAKLKVSFFDGTNADPIATGEVDTVRSPDHGGDSGMVLREVSGGVPAGTQRMLVEWIGTKESPVTDNMRLLADNISLVLSADSDLKLLSISNAATGVAATSVAPGEMVTLAVSGLGLTDSIGMQLENHNSSVKTALSGVTVAFDEIEAPLLYVSEKEIGAIVPFEVIGRETVPVQVRYNVDRSAPLSMNVVSAVPGIFTQEPPASGNTAGLIWNSDWHLNSEGNPAAKGSTVTIFWTGGGQTDPGGITGEIEMQSMAKPVLPVAVTIGGQAAEVVYAESVPNSWAGLLMAEVKVPEGVDTAGPVPVVITLADPVAGNLSSPDGAATMWVQ